MVFFFSEQIFPPNRHTRVPYTSCVLYYSRISSFLSRPSY